jgi:urease accessory protein
MTEIRISELAIFSEHLPARTAAPPGLRTRLMRAMRDNPVRAHLVLPFEQRQKARLRARLSNGVEIGIQLARGTVLRGGDRLRGTDGTVIEVVAAPERVSTVHSRNLQELARAAYHLGNRHVPLEVDDGWVRYLTDHVLDAMVEQLGLPVTHEVEPFEPEAGAYGGHSHSHAAKGAGAAEAPLARDQARREPLYVFGPSNWLTRGRKPAP